MLETIPTPLNLKTDVARVEKPAKRDLWKEAFESLPDDRKEYLRVKNGCSTVDAIDDVISTTKQKYQDWKKRGLKIRRRDGNDFNFRDSVEKILNFALQVKDIISKAVSFDPTGHASEYLAHTLAHYTLIDTHHRDQNVDSDQNLDNALLGVYSALLDYSAEVNKVREQNAVGKPIVQTSGSRPALILTRAAAEEERILDWVSTADYSKIQNETQKFRSANTGNWFLTSDQYQDWKDSAGHILWLSGIVGCGKSVLCERHKNKLHILATSRPEQDIRETLERFPTVDLEAKLAEDVETFVRTEISNGRLLKFRHMQNRILDHLLGTRERRFRWADLQITRLADSTTDKQIKDALQTIPATLVETYREVLDRIEEKDINIAREILLLLCLAPVPLDIQTIADAVSLLSPDLIVKICTTAPVIISEDGAIRLAHFSVKEYLVVSKDVGNDHRFRFTEPKGHHDLAIKTIDHLLSQNEVLTEKVAMSQSFLVYAAKHWDTHVAAAGDVLDIQGKVDRLFTEPTAYFNWLCIA
ncbi:unnamed protein product [Aspergillus oryzae]|nr:unnamed protein product [Aspergillus oryzae]GMF94882.1 unnamed protein product [Aspergillus oryzae]